MPTFQEQAFLDEVVAAAERIELADALGDARRAQDFGHAAPADPDIAEAKAAAERLRRDPGVINRICPALRSVSDDLGTIAKTLGTALLPLALTPAAVVPVSALAMGALAVIVARAGVNAICPKAPAKAAGGDE